MLAIAHTSCTGGSPVVSSESRYCASAGSSSCEPSEPSERMRSWTAAVARARSVTSSPIIRTVHPEEKTIAAASGSAQMLNSAAWFMLPRDAEPPMITKSLTQVASRGSRRSASPILVSGPVATSVISPGAAPMVSMMKSIACPSRALLAGGGSTAPPSPESPCTCPASSAGRSSGAAKPGVTGTSAAPTNDATARAFAVGLGQPDVAGHGREADEVDLGEAVAKAIARASSMPGSQSRMMGVLTNQKVPNGCVFHAPASTSTFTSGKTAPVVPALVDSLMATRRII